MTTKQVKPYEAETSDKKRKKSHLLAVSAELALQKCLFFSLLLQECVSSGDLHTAAAERVWNPS